ncbi:hypothetical protein [Oligoflexus tunisiensis]|uniref:hypothetical protein n=1 Tax=Oligoflexus tunisiensis TaxID=708132 RepID=UPI001C405D14|nr:hypothetical protein [Oligoflexus tunisiensis]
MPSHLFGSRGVGLPGLIDDIHPLGKVGHADGFVRVLLAGLILEIFRFQKVRFSTANLLCSACTT